ncbi:MAG: hypothetical protein DCC75_01145 [Proteobacteria bacterium]|nr:MAG: hypothetical protein DCC75_01145 [Pseudomonadota bacterium]
MIRLLMRCCIVVIAWLFVMHGRAQDRSARVTRVGFITVLSGEYSDVGQATANGARLAIKDYNSANPAEDVRLILEDDGGDPKKGLSAFQKLRTVNKAEIILPISTFTIGSIRELVNRERRITLILGNEPYEPTDDYIYMLTPSAIPADVAFGKHIAKTNPVGKIMVVTSENQAIIRFGRALREGAGARAEIIELPSGLTDYRSIALAILAKGPVAIAFVALPRESALTLKALRELHFTSKLYFDESVINSITDFKTILGDLSVLNSAELLKLASHVDPIFVDRYVRAFGGNSRLWADYAYDAVQLALKLKEKRPEEAREWLANNVYSGVSGEIQFDERGLRRPEYSFVPLKDYL